MPAPNPSSIPALSACRGNIRALTNRDESEIMRDLMQGISIQPGAREVISADAAQTVRTIRREHSPNIMEKFLGEYGLNTDEGVALMCLAEAYLQNTRQRNAGRPDFRQDRRGRLEPPPGQSQVFAGQCLHMGVDAYRQGFPIDPGQGR